MDGILKSTMGNIHKPVHMKGLGRLVLETTGLQGQSPVMEGILANTKHEIKDKAVPELHKVHHRGKTQATKMGMVPYNGPKY